MAGRLRANMNKETFSISHAELSRPDDLEHLDLKQLQSRFNVYNELLAQAIAKNDDMSVKFLEAKLEALKSEMFEATNNIDISKMMETDAEELNKKQLMN